MCCLLELKLIVMIIKSGLVMLFFIGFDSLFIGFDSLGNVMILSDLPLYLDNNSRCFDIMLFGLIVLVL